jgi:hypothetical protein
MDAAFEVPCPAEWLEVRNGKGRVLVDPHGFSYMMKSKGAEDKLFMMCRETRKQKCTAKCIVKGDVILATSGEHNHDTNVLKTRVAKLAKHAIAEAITNPGLPPRAVVASITASIQQAHKSESALGYMIKPKSMARALQRGRKEELGCPPIPRTWEDHVVPDVLRSTFSKKLFCVLDDVVSEEGEKVFGFCSPDGLELLSSSDNWYVDGTFSIVKNTMFTQAWVIVVKTSTDLSVAAAYFLLPNKKAFTYKKVLNHLKVECGIDAPMYIHSDFEDAVFKAVQEIYPSTGRVSCDTHWKRNLTKHIQSSGLGSFYRNNEELQAFVRSLWALSLVPHLEIIKVWDEHISKNQPYIDDDEEDATLYNAALSTFINYFESTYIGISNVTRNGKHTRRKPIFSVDIWSKHEAVLKKIDLTNNHSESWNSAIVKVMPRNASVWAVIDCFKKDEALTSKKIIDAATVKPSTSAVSRDNARKKRQEKLFTLVSNYINLSPNKFLAAASCLYEYTGTN